MFEHGESDPRVMLTRDLPGDGDKYDSKWMVAPRSIGSQVAQDNAGGGDTV